MVGALVAPQPSQARRYRRPRHNFYGRCRPFTIQPVAIAPVLPGETLKQGLIQVRAVTDPVCNSLIGWWFETYTFYVKHRDLDARDILTAMHLSLDTDVSSLKISGDSSHYGTADAQMDWVTMCLKRVTEEYFRNEGEAWDISTINGLPVSGLAEEFWLDSVALADAIDEGAVIDEGGTDTHTNQQLFDAMQQWEFMRANQLTNASFEDYLRSFGVRVAQDEPHKPELLRYTKAWQYPSSVVAPADGVPSSAVSWAISESMDKDRFFPEPGFIFTVALCRPKVYVESEGPLAGWMDSAMNWLPAIMRDEPYTSLKKFANGTGPLPQVTDTDGYWVDLRDLFIHGDQFMFGTTSHPSGYTVSTAQFPNVVDVPLPALAHKYPNEDDAEALFLFASTSRDWVRMDGVLSLSILGTQQDHT